MLYAALEEKVETCFSRYFTLILKFKNVYFEVINFVVTNLIGYQYYYLGFAEEGQALQ